MKVTTLNNAEIVLQAKDQADYEKMMQVAERMIQDTNGHIEMASNCEYEMWVHLCAVWDNYQAKELKAEYQQAKKAIK